MGDGRAGGCRFAAGGWQGHPVEWTALDGPAGSGVGPPLPRQAGCVQDAVDVPPTAPQHLSVITDNH